MQFPIKDQIKKRIKQYWGPGVYLKLKRIYYSVINIVNVQKKIIGYGNKIQYEGAFLKNVVFDIRGNNSRVHIHKNTTILNTKVTITGDQHELIIGRDSLLQDAQLCYEDSNCSIRIGRGTMIFKGVRISAVEPGRRVDIGEKTMIGEGSDIRTTDSHSIIDLNSGKRINPGGDVNIGDRVWITKDVNILKGVTIGDDVVIGIRSLVTKDIPANCIAAGAPARVARKNISWTWERID